jgi:hypothetical protein
LNNWKEEDRKMRQETVQVYCDATKQLLAELIEASGGPVSPQDNEMIHRVRLVNSAIMSLLGGMGMNMPSMAPPPMMGIIPPPNEPPSPNPSIVPPG